MGSDEEKMAIFCQCGNVIWLVSKIRNLVFSPVSFGSLMSAGDFSEFTS